MDKNKQLAIVQTSNQDTPLSMGQTPLIGIDVWEHAYYLKYQNTAPGVRSSVPKRDQLGLEPPTGIAASPDNATPRTAHTRAAAGGGLHIR